MGQLDDQDLKERAAQIETLVEEMASFKDADARTKMTELLQALLQLYGEGLSRVLEIVGRQDSAIVNLLAQDELIAHLLFLHGLHPVPVETRVAAALEEVRPYLQSHGGSVELVGMMHGVAQLRLHGSCRGCPSSAMTLKLTIEDALGKAAPDLEGIVVEEMNEPQPGPMIIPLTSLSRPEPAVDSER